MWKYAKSQAEKEGYHLEILKKRQTWKGDLDWKKTENDLRTADELHSLVDESDKVTLISDEELSRSFN